MIYPVVSDPPKLPDKDGYYTEVILFDEKSNLLYYERMRFHAFQ